MVYTTTKLINNAYYATGIVGREFETVQGYQLEVGLNLLNEIIADKTINTEMVPYIQQYQFYGIVGQEKYFIPNLIEIEAITFFLNGKQVRYSIQKRNRKDYFGSPRANNINSLLTSYHMERSPGGADVYFYFFPDQAYPITITGTFRIPPVVYEQDLASYWATINLGQVAIGGGPLVLTNTTILGTGTLAAGELVINGVDLAGTYTSPIVLAAAIQINVPNTTALAVGLSIILSNNVAPLILATLGTVTTNGVTFANFNTTAGAFTLTQQPPGHLSPGQLVINSIDLMGAYATAQDLVTYINTGIVPNVTALLVNNDLTLNATNAVAINLSTLGFVTPSYITFQYFSTISGQLNQTYNSAYLDQFYIDYLKYELADRICTEYNMDVPPGVAKQLAKFEAQIRKQSAPIDLSMQKISTMDRSGFINYGQANLGKGWSTN